MKRDKNRLNLELHYAVIKGDLDKVRSLVSEGADVFFEDNLSMYAAVTRGRIEIINYFISLGVPVTYKYLTWCNTNLRTSDESADVTYQLIESILTLIGDSNEK